jgi:hypothetical protein
VKTIVAMLVLAFACVSTPAFADPTTLYWNVDVTGVISSSTLQFSPDIGLGNPEPGDPGYIPPYTLTCSVNCGTFDFQAATTAVPVFVNGQEFLNIGGAETVTFNFENIVPLIESTISGGCDTDCPMGFTGVLDINQTNAGNGTTSLYGPYPGSGYIDLDYQTFASDGQSNGSVVYTSVYSTVSVSLTTNAAVPELSTWALILLGFAGLGVAGYRRGRGALSTGGGEKGRMPPPRT